MLNYNSLPSQSAISLFLSLRQNMIFRFLERGLAVFMKFCHALISSICQNAKVLCEVTAIILEQLKIVLASITKSRGNNLSAFSISNYLRFLGMTLLFATVMPFLAFFGRSIGCSLTSTSTTSNTVSLAWRVFLPGKRNLPERTKAFSTFRIVRQTVASLMPYDWAIWNSVRYSRQYIKVSNNWSARLNLVGLPKSRQPFSTTFSIWLKVSRGTPVSRLKSVSLRCSIVS